jgi:phosphoglycerol transferase MdoB-like AlkP superfamily enzyme
MKSVFSFYLRYILFLLGIQLMFRILFLLVYQNLAQDAGIWSQILALVYGLKLDVSLAAYILLFPTFVLIIFSIFRLGILKIIVGIYTFLVLLCIIPAYFTNLVTYQYWKFPIDRSIFDYISTPGDMIASISPWSLIFYLGMIVLVIYALFFQIYRKWVSRSMTTVRNRSWVAAALFLIILPSLILPIRGRKNLPIQTGAVYFHQNVFINHAALNPVWNLIYTMIEGDKLTQSANYYPDPEAREIMNELYEQGETHSRVLHTDSPNIILIILESFSRPVIAKLGGSYEIAPNFNELVSQGIFFNKFFASGTMTDRAIGAVLGGYPSVPGTCILHYESKSQKLPSLNRELKSKGYSSAFLYGGDIDFAHINSFLVMGGFENIISEDNFSRSIPRSSWGVPDHFLFQKLLDVSDQAREPFFHVVMTLSSHTPFDVPMEPVFPGSGELVKYKNSIYYTDKSLGEFIKTAETRDWWDQTLIVLMADHGFRVSDLMAHDPNQFCIPMLWIGGALQVSDTIITKFGSQTDLPVTLLHQLGLPGDDFIFSKDLLSPDTKSFAYYTYNDGIGFLNDSCCAVYSLIKGNYLVDQCSGSQSISHLPLAYLQFLLHDFNGK